MEIKNSFDIPAPPDQAWALLMDIPRITPCMPGAELTEETADGGYKGKVSVKLGPVALSFTGVARFEERDETAKRASVKAQGSDQKGRGGASATVVFQLSPAGAGSRIDIVTDVTLTGLVAQYGRGSGVIQGVANHLVGQFADNLRGSLDAGSHGVAGGGAAGGTVSMPAVKPIGGFSLVLRVIGQALLGLFSRKA